MFLFQKKKDYFLLNVDGEEYPANTLPSGGNLACPNAKAYRKMAAKLVVISGLSEHNNKNKHHISLIIIITSPVSHLC